MDNSFCINVDHLRDGSTEEIEESFSPKVLDIHEADLTFDAPVKIKGDAFVAGSALVVRFSGTAIALMPCAICNEAVPFTLKVDNFYYSQEISKIKGGVFNLKDILREAFLLELPRRVECNEGNCPERKNIEQYLSLN